MVIKRKIRIIYIFHHFEKYIGTHISKKIRLKIIIHFHNYFCKKMYEVQKISKYKSQHPYFYCSGKMAINILKIITWVIFILMYILKILGYSKHAVS